MKNPYIFMFGKQAISTQKVFNDLPYWSRYPLSIGSEEVLHQLKKGHILLQRLNLKPFLIDLIEHKAEEPFNIDLKITGDQIFFYFMLHGSISVRLYKTETVVTTSRANRFYVSQTRPGLLTVSGDKGEHIGLLVSIDTDWIKNVANEFDTLKKFVEDFQNLSRKYEIMPHCRMDKKIHCWLKEIYSFDKKNKGALDGLLRLYISLALEHYHKLVNEREGMLIYRVKHYIDNHFCEHDLNAAKLTEIFFATERTLRNQFKTEFNTTIHDYYTKLRMERAKYLIDTLNKPVRDVHFDVGYIDESSFRYAYNKYTRKLGK